MSGDTHLPAELDGPRPGGSDAPFPLSIPERLATPGPPVPVERLWESWRHARITVTCARPADLDDGPTLPARIRGAWGHRLREIEALGQASPAWSNGPSAAAIFFDELARGPFGGPLPKPFTIAVDSDHGQLTVMMTLIGFASYWREEATAALIAALEGGIALRSVGGIRVPFEILSIKAAERESLPAPPPVRGTGVFLHFRTPLCVRHGTSLTDGASTLFPSLALRVGGLCAWQDVAASADWKALKRQWATAARDAEGLRPVHWERYSSRKAGRAVPMNGLTGLLRLEGDLEPLMPLLHLGQHVHAGSHAALGLGRYDLIA